MNNAVATRLFTPPPRFPLKQAFAFFKGTRLSPAPRGRGTQIANSPWWYSNPPKISYGVGTHKNGEGHFIWETRAYNRVLSLAARLVQNFACTVINPAFKSPLPQSLPDAADLRRDGLVAVL